MRVLVAVFFLLAAVTCADAATGKSKVKVSVKDASIAVSGAGEDSLGDDKPLTFGQKHSTTIQLEGKQQLKLKFKVVDEKSQPITVHQAFVIFVHASTKQEIAYVAEPETQTKAYTFELNLKTHAKEFAGLSGEYNVRLILGDASVTNPVNWHFADVQLKIPATKPAELPKSQMVDYNPKPEITHLFREPEARPPNFAADVFALLCAAPLLIVVIAWLRIGINFGNFPLSLWPLGFHAGLTAIFGLYFMFWLKLNMFVTLKYLAILVVPTYFFGQRLFNSLSAQRKSA